MRRIIPQHGTRHSAHALDRELTAEDYHQGQLDCVLLMRIYGRTPLLLSWFDDMTAGRAKAIERNSEIQRIEAELDAANTSAETR